MNARKSPPTSKPSRLLPLLILAASATGCSTFSEEMQALAKLADATQKAEQAIALVEAKAPPATLPELSPKLRRCLAASKVPAGKSKQAKAGAKIKQPAKGQVVDPAKEVQGQSPSADTLVLARLEAARKRDACARLLLQWYEQQVKSQPKVMAEARK